MKVSVTVRGLINPHRSNIRDSQKEILSILIKPMGALVALVVLDVLILPPIKVINSGLEGVVTSVIIWPMLLLFSIEVEVGAGVGVGGTDLT